MNCNSKTVEFIQSKFRRKDFIGLHEPVFFGNERKYVLEAIDSTYVSSVGAFVDLFENLVSAKSETRKAIAVVNGTAGLHMALMLSGVTANTEVITQALTFVATINAITYIQAHPVFLDVDLDTMGLSPKAVEHFLLENAEIRENACYNKKTNRRITACLPMHTFGFPVHFEELEKVCTQWHIPIVEDAAESLGSRYQTKATGSLGKVGVFSFNGNKIVTSGGGGAIVTNNEELGALAKHLTTTAKVKHSFEFVHDQLGYNYRMPNLNAALACAQIEQLDLFLQNKRTLAEDYATFFQSIGMHFRKELPNTTANYWLMCLELNNRKERDVFLAETNSAGVMTRPIWQLMFKLPMFESCQRDDQQNAIFLEERIVNIPSSVRHES